MDVSVVAAVGSFFMSERVLKPKATVLFILGLILAYDLTTKTHDVSSLRVYRGPALVAFTLLMSAYSLRMWRRNGVACDELLFLPGTPHGVTHGVDSPLPNISSNNNNNTGITNSGGRVVSADTPVPEAVVASRAPAKHSHSESDVAAGGPLPDALDLRRRSRSVEDVDAVEPGFNTNSNNNNSNQANANSNSNAASNKRGITLDEMRQNSVVSNSQVRILGDVELTAQNKNRLRTESFDSSLGWGSDDEEDDELLQRRSSEEQQKMHNSDADLDAMENERGCLREHGTSLLCRSNTHTRDEDGPTTSNESDDNYHGLDLHHFRENHPQITRIGSFFFFRNTASSTHNAAYAPSGPAVVGAALDLSMPILFNFHLYIEAFNHIKPKDAESEAPAKILPIIFLSVLIVRSVVPPGRRGRFWSTLKFTVMSPFHQVRFRDAFVGDVITSMVRPGQDILFALSYYVTVIWGSITGKYGLTESGQILEGSWILHNVILPSCALLPLWWKFLQTLRQAYDEERRWPHFGNALKYLTATLVILYGMTHPENRRSPWWIVAFLCSLLFQIWWDVMMDWELLEVPQNQFRSTLDSLSVENWLTNISSVKPDSHVLMTLQINIFTPLAEGWRRTSARIRSLKHIRLRSKRLYKTEKFYWRILAFNAAMRFTWMLCFIPAYRLSSSGEEKVTTFSSDVNSYVGVLLPVTEIVRRTLWGILLLERKTIQMTEDDGVYARLETNDYSERGEELEDQSGDHDDDDDQLSGGDHSQTGKGAYQMYLPLWLNAQQQMQHDSSNHSSISEKLTALTGSIDLGENFIHNLFLCELGLWAAGFVGLGCWAAS